MAAILKIRQNLISESGLTTKGPLVWTYVNTTMEDESYIIRNGLVPLGILASMKELTVQQEHDLELVMKRFFGQGYFLSGENWITLQSILNAHGYEAMELDDNGCYDQPLDAKNKKTASPTKKAWTLNGKRRLKEYDAVFAREIERMQREFAAELAAEQATREGAAEESRRHQRAEAERNKPREDAANTLISFI